MFCNESVCLNKSDAEKLEELNEQYGVQDIYPSHTISSKTSLRCLKTIWYKISFVIEVGIEKYLLSLKRK